MKKPLRMMTETEKAYIAGIIDGEGSIYFKRDGERHSICIAVRNTALKLLQWLVDHSGVGTIRKLKLHGNRQSCWEWRMTPNQAFMLLDAIHSYVVIKLEQIEKALQFQRLPVAERFTQGARYHEEMKALHLPGNRKLTAHQTSDETSI